MTPSRASLEHAAPRPARAAIALTALLALTAVLGLPGCGSAAGESDGEAGGAQETAEASAAMDAVYDRFTRAYRLGEPDSVLALYTDDPLYLPGQGPVVRGREALRRQFAFLESIRADSAVAHISFESLGRGADGDLGWDVGYYTLQVERPGGQRTPPSRGKFTTVWRRDADGRWRIHVDGFSPAPPPAS